MVPTANNCDAIPDSLTREDNPLTVHFRSLGIATVPSSPIRPREAGPSEAPQLVLACQTTLNIEHYSYCCYRLLLLSLYIRRHIMGPNPESEYTILWNMLSLSLLIAAFPIAPVWKCNTISYCRQNTV